MPVHEDSRGEEGLCASGEVRRRQRDSRLQGQLLPRCERLALAEVGQVSVDVRNEKEVKYFGPSDWLHLFPSSFFKLENIVHHCIFLFSKLGKIPSHIQPRELFSNIALSALRARGHRSRHESHRRGQEGCRPV